MSLDTQKTVIGAKTTLDLPVLEMSKIPAKIDTGADSSAIWASNIKEERHGLRFTLFDKISSHYSGKKVRVNNYKRSVIKNSFGELERRYKVPLTVVIEGRKIKAWFTLANRKDLSYPILIGRKTLNNKFLVDVSFSETKRKHSKLKNVLLVDNRRIATVTKMAEKIVHESKQKLSITPITYEDIAIKVGPTGTNILIPKYKKSIEYYDAIYLKTRLKNMEIASTIAKFAGFKDIKVVDESLKHFPGISKIHQYVVLSEAGISVPKTLFLPQFKGAYKACVAGLGSPFILKDNLGSKGENNYLIKNQLQFNEVVKSAVDSGLKMVAQEFIDNDGDYRLIVMGGEVALINMRQRKNDETHLNNTSRGAKSKEIDKSELPSSVIKTALRAANLMRLNIAGVDMVKDKESDLWYCLEVNDSPQIASGALIDKKRSLLANFLEKL